MTRERADQGTDDSAVEGIEPRTTFPGESDQEVLAGVLHDLADNYSQQGRVEDALALYAEAVELFRQGLGDEPDSSYAEKLAIALIDHGAEVANDGNPERARGMFEDALEQLEPTTASQRDAMATALSNLEAVLLGVGDVDATVAVIKGWEQLSEAGVKDANEEIIRIRLERLEYYRGRAMGDEAAEEWAQLLAFHGEGDGTKTFEALQRVWRGSKC